MVKKLIHCSTCLAVLCSDEISTGSAVGDLFITQKDRGGLLKPSAGVVKICRETEHCFQRMLLSTKQKLPQMAGIKLAITMAVLSELCCDGKSPFQELHEHMFDTSIDNNHMFTLVKCIADCYCKIKFHQLAKQFNDNMAPNKIRKQLTKLILFKNQ